MVANRVKRVAPSATLSITGKAKALKAAGSDIISLSAGEPDFDTPIHIKNSLNNAVENGFVYYTPSAGIIELRKAISKKLRTDNKIAYDPKTEVICTPGAKHALFEAILAITNPKDEILIPSPFWVSYEPMVQLAGGKPVFIETNEENRFQLTSEALDNKITKKTKGIIINSPNNPTGAVFKKKALKEIAGICSANEIKVISDEIYEKIIYSKKHISIATFPEMKESTITINGFSKAYSMTGWRLGYAAAPSELITAMGRIQEHSVSCPTSFVQKAGITALESSQECVKQMVKEYRKRRNVIVEYLNNIENVTCTMPDGSFYVFANFSFYEKDSLKLTDYLLSKGGVSVIPGSAFGDLGEGYLRISYATNIEDILEGLKRIKKAIKELN
jgi:aspartate aminotransferase